MTYDDSKNRVNFWVKAFLAALGSVLGAAGLSAGSASAGSAVSETVLHSFCSQQTNCTGIPPVCQCIDGQFPMAGLIATTNGALYGTTELGGNAGNGVAFLVTVTGSYGLLHAFQFSSMDGYTPQAPLFRDNSGNFYGTTGAGGAYGGGTVFERSASGVYRLRHAFNGSDGAGPLAGVIADSAGNLYGTTNNGGANKDSGTIFRLTPSGILTTLHSFCSMTGCADGVGPGFAGLIGDANGNLYGTTQSGGGTGCFTGQGCGVVFKIHADGTGYTVLHAFMGGTDGFEPLAGLSADPSGNLYGTTEFGGSGPGCSGSFGCGVAFKIAPDGSNYAVLYNFCSLASCADGAEPVGGVIVDAAGNLYGTTSGGGANNQGAVFALTPSGTETVLHSFGSSAADGSDPIGNLIALGPCNLYGTTIYGGTIGDGTVYELTNTGFVP